MENRFFDSASTTRCCQRAVQLVSQYAVEDFGNPSSSHLYGRKAAQAIREARAFFTRVFRVEPEQVIFTGSGTEADNLAIQGLALGMLARKQPPGRILVSASEHPAVRKTALALSALAFDVKLIPVERDGQIRREALLDLLTPETQLVSIHQVNNITGALLPVSELARLCKEKIPSLLFHTDAVQSFGKTAHPESRSGVDLVSISGHKVRGPKSVGALVILNPELSPRRNSGLRPILWGGEQEHGLRSGTQNAGLIAGFAAGAEESLSKLAENAEHCARLRARLLERLDAQGLRYHLNSPSTAVPHILSLSFPGCPSGPLFRLLEERGFYISTGSACSSTKPEPDPVLEAMGLPRELSSSALRISFSELNSSEDVDALAQALGESLQRMALLTGGPRSSQRKK